jgi:hypothetical protein
MKLEISIDDLRKHSLFIGVPMYGGSCMGIHAKSSTDLGILCTKYGITAKFYYIFNESLIQRARNYIVDEFMRSDCTHLMFIDADIGFNATDVISLLGIQISNPDKYHVITAPYPKKTIAWEKVYAAATNDMVKSPFELADYVSDFVFNPVQGISSFRLDEPVEVSEAGTGFMLIPRTTLEMYSKAYPEYKYKPDHVRTANFDGSRDIMAYFDCVIDPESRRYLSEDYFFCKNVRKMGKSVYMCPWMKLDHVGSYIFKGNMETLAKLGASPTSSKSSNPKNFVDKSRKKIRIKTRP